MNTFNVKRCNERKAYEVHIKEKDHELDVAIKYAPKIEELLLGSRIEYLSEFGLDDGREEGVNKDLCWCSGIVERVCY